MIQAMMGQTNLHTKMGHGPTRDQPIVQPNRLMAKQTGLIQSHGFNNLTRPTYFLTS